MDVTGNPGGSAASSGDVDRDGQIVDQIRSKLLAVIRELQSQPELAVEDPAGYYYKVGQMDTLRQLLELENERLARRIARTPAAELADVARQEGVLL